MFASNQNVTMTNQKCKIFTQRNDRRSIFSSNFHKSGIIFLQEILQCVLQMQFNWKNKIMRIMLTQNILTICLFLDILTNQIKRKTLRKRLSIHTHPILVQNSATHLMYKNCAANQTM